MSSQHRLRARLCLLALLAAAPAAAQTDMIRAEVRPGWRMATGAQMAAVHIRLAPEWKTYWRAPGDNGIPPSFDWTGSENVKSVRFHWPRPTVFDVNGLTTIGYKHELVLPIEVTPKDPSRPMRLRALVDVGVCLDICVPAEFTFDAVLSGPGATDPAITSALLARPATAHEAGLAGLRCSVTPIDDGLRVTAEMDLPETGGREIVVFEPGLPGVWVSEADVSRTGGHLTASADMVGPGGVPFALQRGAVVMTVMGQKTAVEILGCPAA